MFMLRSVLPVLLFLLSGCGWNGTPTRSNDFTPLTSIEIVPASASIAGSKTIAVKTSTPLRVIGNYSGLYTKDITDQAVWTSATPAVAAFSTTTQPSRITGVTAGTSAIGATAQGFTAPPFTLTVSSATIAAVTVTPATTSIAKGLTGQLSASGTFSDSSSQDLTFDAAWTSGTPAIATVGNSVTTKGLVQAVAVGSATITATFDGSNGTSAVTVTAPTLQSLSVTPANPSVLSVSTTNFKAIGTYTDGTTADLSSSATWESSLTGIATIVSATGVTTTIAPGTTVIKATASGFSGSTNLKVTGGSLSSIALSLDKFTPQSGIVTMVKDTSARVMVTGTFNNGSTRDITGGVMLSTTGTAATVTKPGGNLAWLNSTAVTTTPITVSASFSQLSAVAAGSTQVTVIAPTIQTMTILPTGITDLATGASRRVEAIATYSDTTVQNVTANVTWASAATATATVGTSELTRGLVTGVAAGGPINITATYGGLSPFVPVTVLAKTVASVAISGATSLPSGMQRSYTATATFTDNTTADVTETAVWSIDSASANVAVFADKVNQPGQVVAVDSGSTALAVAFGGKSASVTLTVP